MSAAASGAVVASCARGGDEAAGAGVVAGGVVCLCLSGCFHGVSAMFFYMYENMAEFCLLGCSRHAGADVEIGTTGCLEGDASENAEACEDTQAQQAHERKDART